MAQTRLTIQISDRLEEILNQLAKDDGIPKAQVIRRAIAVLKFLEDEKKNGNKITISSHDDRVLKELVVQ